MAFQGSLAELHLPDIIQLVSVSGKTGIFYLTDGTLKGQIFLNDVDDAIDATNGPCCRAAYLQQHSVTRPR